MLFNDFAEAASSSNTIAAKEVYCECGGPKHKDFLIHCSKSGCNKTFHGVCLGWRSQPEKTWICPACNEIDHRK